LVVVVIIVLRRDIIFNREIREIGETKLLPDLPDLPVKLQVPVKLQDLQP
jgi:hypothetical protein